MLQTQVTTETSCKNTREHPAVRAWHRFAGDRAEPDSIQVLKRNKRHSVVYRLAGMLPGRATVIAKRANSDLAATEKIIYGQILPQLPVSALRLYGSTADDDPGLCWLFLEDAGQEMYSAEIEDHRILAGRWLGLMHTSVQGCSLATSLPDRSSIYHLEELRRARAAILEILQHPVFPATDRLTLNAIVCHCQELEARWDYVDQLCECIPRTLVHGDLAAKNACVRTSDAGKELLVMDWEGAGWGIPAADLAQFVFESLSPALDAYWLVAQPRLPQLAASDVHKWAELGTVFRLIVAFSWANSGFYAGAAGRAASRRQQQVAEWYMTDMRFYEPALDTWLRATASR
jgi:Phosphotransferase enzyme family